MTDSDLQRARQGIGTRTREARIAKGLTQAELGKRVGLNQSVVALIEEGVLWHPSVVSGLAMALDVTPAWVHWGERLEDKRVE